MQRRAKIHLVQKNKLLGFALTVVKKKRMCNVVKIKYKCDITTDTGNLVNGTKERAFTN